MNRVIRHLSIIIFLVFLSNINYAEPIATARAIEDHTIGFEINTSAMTGLEFGYSYRFQNIIKDHHLDLRGYFGFPLFLVDQFDTFYFGVSASSELYSYKNFGIFSGLSFEVNTQKNLLGRFTTLLTELSVIPGYYGTRGYFGLYLGWKQNWTTYIHHSDYVKSFYDNRYPDNIQGDTKLNNPKNGWYITPVTNFSVGISSGILIKKRVTLYLDMGMLMTPTKVKLFSAGMIGMLPFYMRTGIDVHFGKG